ncbi:MAG: Hsp20/alpha crystallin family protein [Phycisphaerales bacterium]
MIFLTRRGVTTPPNPWALLEQVLSEPVKHRSCEPRGESAEPLALDVSEDAEAVTVKANVPGFAREQIDIEMHDGVLTISAKRVEEKQEQAGTVHRRERYVGSLARRVALPSLVVESAGKAELRDGVLTLRLPKSQENSPRKIAID